jgi:hypothetical protein
MRRLRQLHNLLGAFFAPAIIFFAVSGALQTFSLHENHDGGPYRPPAWIVAMASIHKDQTLPEPNPTEDAHDRAKGEAPEHHHPEDARSPLPLKIFVLLLAIGLATTAIMGLVIALRNRATRRSTLIMVALGTLLPVALLFV